MTRQSDAKYFKDRAKESRAAAVNAEYPGSSEIHTTLAVAYDDLADKATDPRAARDFPSKVEAVNGEVQVEGLEKGIVSFTPNAARMTSDSLLRGANEAGSQDPQGDPVEAERKRAE
jgi:hypothetical protein